MPNDLPSSNNNPSVPEYRSYSTKLTDERLDYP